MQSKLSSLPPTQLSTHLPVRLGTRPSSRNAAGFTLLELVVAVAIFAVMGVAMYTQLTQVMTAKDRTDAYSKRLNEIQRAMLVIQQDVEQIVQRPVRDEYGDLQPTVKSALGGVEFTRTGWTVSPFTKQQRSELQRVRYSYEGGELVRSHWLYPDQASGEQPDSLVLLSGLEAFSVNFMSPPPSPYVGSGSSNVNAELNRSSDWPPLELSGGGGAPNGNNSRLPKLIEFTFTLERMGEIRRLFRLVSEHKFEVTGSRGEGVEGDGDNDQDGNQESDQNSDQNGGQDGEGIGSDEDGIEEGAEDEFDDESEEQ